MNANAKVKSGKSSKWHRAIAREARAEADALIEQLTRIDRGWDTGKWRDDMPHMERDASNTIKRQIAGYVSRAFGLSADEAMCDRYDADEAAAERADRATD